MGWLNVRRGAFLLRWPVPRVVVGLSKKANLVRPFASASMFESRRPWRFSIGMKCVFSIVERFLPPCTYRSRTISSWVIISSHARAGANYGMRPILITPFHLFAVKSIYAESFPRDLDILVKSIWQHPAAKNSIPTFSRRRGRIGWTYKLIKT